MNHTGVYDAMTLKEINSEHHPAWFEDLNYDQGVGEINGEKVLFLWPKWYVPGRGIKVSAINETLEKYGG